MHRTLLLSLPVALAACSGSGSSTTSVQVVPADCRVAILACEPGYLCREVGDQAFACVPVDGDAAEPPDVEPRGSDAGVDAAPEDLSGPAPDESTPDVAPPVDTAPPPLVITLALADGQVLTGLAPVGATVTGATALLGVEVQVDGQTVATDIIPPYSVLVNTAQFLDGPHEVTAWVADRSGRTAHATVPVAFDNTPPVILTLSPPAGPAVFFEDGPLHLAVTVGEPQTVSSVEIRAAGLLLGELSAPPFEVDVPWTQLFVQPEQLPRTLPLHYRVEDALGQVTEAAHDVTVHLRHLFTFETLGEIWGAPAALPNGNVVFGNLDSRVVAVTPAGEQAWSYAASGDVTFSVTVDPQTGRIFFGTLDGNAAALEQNGALVWTQSLGSPPGGQPALAGGKLYVASFDGHVRELAVSDGQVGWTATLPGQITSSPAAAPDGTVFVGCQDHSLYAIKAGATLWSTPTGGEVWSAPAIGPTGTVYFGSNDGWIYAVKTAGEPLWKAEIEGQIWGRPLVTPDLELYVSSTSKHLQKLNALDGAVIWDAKLQGMTYSSPVLDADGTVYVGTTPGILYALDAETGALRFSYTVGDTIHGTPLLLGDRLVFGSTNRNLTAIWRFGVTLPGP